MKKGVFALAVILLLTLFGCDSQESGVRTDSANFLTDLAALAEEDLNLANAYVGKTYEMTLEADQVFADEILFFVTDTVTVDLEVTEAVKDVQLWDVFTMEGVVESFEERGEYLRIHIRPTKYLKDTYQISGKIGNYFYSLAADWPEKSFYVIDSSVLPGRQIMIYIPRNAEQQLGEPFTVEGRLFSVYTGEYSEISAMDVDDLGAKTLHMVDPVFLEGKSK